jgi:hypothetical protein
MIRYELYINKTLYMATESPDQAFAAFRRWTGQGNDVKMKFVRLSQAIAV